MKKVINIITYDYLQRTRSYEFLITLCISLAIAYSFVPEPNANYSTIRIGHYLGYYNSAWFGYVTALMTSIFLSLIGFYLVNSGIKTDVNTRVGQIMAATPMKNLIYLLSKTLSNFLVLSTIVILVFLMSVILFILYHDQGFSFEVTQFITPYLLITFPAIFFVSAIAVVSEVVLGRFSMLQNIVFFFLFIALMANTTGSIDTGFNLDVFGSKIVIHQMEEEVNQLIDTDEQRGLTIGYVLGNTSKAKNFEFKGVNFPQVFILSRFLWVLLSLLLVIAIAPFFHRFSITKSFTVKKPREPNFGQSALNSIVLSRLPLPQVDFGIFAILKTEVFLLVRQGKKWMWLLSFIGVVLLGVLPLDIAHKIVLPILWFLQVGRLSELTSKEFMHSVHYFSVTSYKPLKRLLTSQILVAFLLLTVLALPLLIRQAVYGNFVALLSIVLGAFALVLVAAILGMVSKGKKLFEVLFFMVSYANINGIPFLDYFGGINTSYPYVIKSFVAVLILDTTAFLIRNRQLQK